MGIPKFFRYISERWPQISQLIDDGRIPEFDNLYLDMNSILHNCTHKDNDVSHHMTEEEMYLAIFNYIEHLFTLIKPKKLFYMAIDGVAPRAKMNQQRARRFRTALDAENARRKAREQGQELPEDPFDSNCITPGTVFMAKLTKQLKYFIHRKVSEDSSWQNIDIILSGHEVPGEGEHKIMEQIRFARAQADYDSNTRHCLYGLDADLIMLGLSTHDPHFAILREEVTFGPSRKKTTELNDQNFYLLHLSLVREYLELEFDDAKDTCAIPFDFERVLDDFILIFFFIGNDFLPELPSLLINDGALPTIIKSYKKYLESCTGYLSNSGIIDFENMRLWLDVISLFEFEKFEEKSLDADWFNQELASVAVHNKDKSNKISITSHQKELLALLKPFILKVNNDDVPDRDTPPKDLPSYSFTENLSKEDLKFVHILAGKTYCRVIENPNDESKHTVLLDLDGIPETEDEDDHEERVLNVNRILKKYETAPILKEEEIEKRKEMYSEKFHGWRNDYYKKKFEFSPDEIETKVVDVAENYLEGLQWVLLYYYRGIASWGWYFRYHYSPRITDIKLGLNKKIAFNKGKPFRPFEQLMGVLPERSKALVPPAYQSLMTDELSPIIDFYPHEFALDMNGKKNDWEAVVKIPFVDENRLLKALETRRPHLSPEEKARDGFGTNLIFRFNPQVDSVYQSSIPGIVPDIQHSHCVETVLDPYPTEADGIKFRFGLVEGAKLGVESLAGFPSMKTIPFTHSLEMAGCTVFQMPSRNESIIVSLQNVYKGESANAVAGKLVSDSVHVGWPFLQEAKVLAVSDEMFRYTNKNQLPHDPSEVSLWHKRANSSIETYLKKSGVKIGPVEMFVHVRFLKGLKRLADGSYVKDFGDDSDPEHAYPLQTIVESVVNEDERFKEREPLPLEKEFPIDSQAVFLGPTGYGNPVTVKGYTDGRLDILLMKIARNEPSIGARTAEFERKVVRYMASYDVTKILHINALFLSKLTSRMLVLNSKGQRVDLGLNLRSEAKRLKVLGYSRKGLRSWEYTSKALELIDSYRKSCPEVFKALSASAQVSAIPDLTKYLSVPADKADEYISKARKWLVANASLETVSFETDALSPVSVQKIEQYIVQYFQNPETVQPIEYRNIPRDALLIPSNAYHQLRHQRFDLGDRVVSALDFGKVKLFNRGTVVGIDSTSSKVMLKVLFDQEFEQGSTLNGLCSTKRGLTVDAGSVVNLSNRQLVVHSKKSAEAASASVKGKNASKTFKPSTVTENAWKAPQPFTKVLSREAPTSQKPVQNANAAPAAKNVKSAKPAKAHDKHTAKNAGPKKSSGPQKTPGEVKVLKKDVQQHTAADNEKASNELLSMLKVNATEKSGSEPDAQPAKPKVDSNELLSNFKGGKEQKQLSHKRLMGALMNSYGGVRPQQPPQVPPQQAGMPLPFLPPPHPAGFFPDGMPMPPPPPGFIPPPPPPGFPLYERNTEVDVKASSELMAQLNIGGDKDKAAASEDK